jgi:UDP-N-acetyl-D-glucosamine dehydrogenase
MKIAIIGQGYVGLTISAFASEFFDVVGFDTSDRIVNQLNSGISHIEGVSSSVLQDWIRAGRYKATSFGGDLEGSDVVVIAVPTPLTKNRQPDLAYIDAACKQPLEVVTPDVIHKLYPTTDTGTPAYIAVDGDSFSVSPS